MNAVSSELLTTKPAFQFPIGAYVVELPTIRQIIRCSI